MNARSVIAVGLASSALAWGAGASVAQTSAPAPQPSDCPKPGTLEEVEGQVVKVDMGRNLVSIRGFDGTTHEFQASKETLQDMKVGDKIEAKLRVAEKCKKG